MAWLQARAAGCSRDWLPTPPDNALPWQGVFGAGAHSDYGMLTILKTDEHPGLQIWSGGRFVDVPPRSGTFIINLGDMLERCNMAVLCQMAACKACHLHDALR